VEPSKPKPKLSLMTIILPIIGLAAFFAYILLFNVDIPEIISTAKRADLRIYSAAILISLAEVFFYAVSWRAILKSLKVKISILRSFLYTWYGIFMDIVIPAESISGELCRIYLVNREQCGTSGRTVASVVMQRIIGMGINVVMLALGIAFLFDVGKINAIVFNAVLFFTIAVASIMILLMLISWKESWSARIINGLIHFGELVTRGRWKQKLAKIKEETLQAAKTFHDSMKELGRKPKTLIWPTLLLILNWISSLAIPYLVFLSLGLDVHWTVILITSSIVIAVKSIPVGIPFEVGLPEITMTTLYTLMGVPAPIAATATILSRILTLWLRFGIGFAVQQWIEIRTFFITPPKQMFTEKA
jgi:uncharacterized protein (TIRG00374 family)